MSKAAIFAITIVVLILLCFGKYVSVKNTLVAKNEAVKSSWSQVDIVLQRRADLIPNLVETVKGITKQEQAGAGRKRRARPPSASSRTARRPCPTPMGASEWRHEHAWGRRFRALAPEPRHQSPEEASAGAAPK